MSTADRSNNAALWAIVALLALLLVAGVGGGAMYFVGQRADRAKQEVARRAKQEEAARIEAIKAQEKVTREVNRIELESRYAREDLAAETARAKRAAEITRETMKARNAPTPAVRP
jgi:uncharacterized protein HemX